MISDLQTKLGQALDLVQTTKKSLDAAESAASKAKTSYDDAVQKAIVIRTELDSELNAILPALGGRVRLAG